MLLNGVNKILVEVMMFCQFCTRSKDQHNGFFLSHFNSANSLKQQYTRQERHFALLGHIILISCHLAFQRFNALKRRAHQPLYHCIGTVQIYILNSINNYHKAETNFVYLTHVVPNFMFSYTCHIF